MRLHSPGFQRSLRRKVKAAIRSSRELRREFKQANKYRKQYNGAIVVRLLLSTGCAFLVWRVADVTRHPVPALAVVTLWTAVAAFLHAQFLWRQLYLAPDLAALTLLPVSEETIFTWELQRFLRRFVLTLLDFLGGYGSLALFLNFSAQQWLAILPVALLSCVSLFALVALMVAYLPPTLFRLISGGLMALISLGFLGGMALGFHWDLLITALDRSGGTLNLLLPTGWSVSLFELLLPDRHWSLLALLIPITALVSMLPAPLHRLLSRQRFTEMVRAEAPDLLPAETVVPPQMPLAAETPTRVGQTEIEELVQSRQFMVRPQWHNRGWIETILWRWLTEREKILADFLAPNGFVISTTWKRIFRNLGVTVLAMLLASIVGPMVKLWVLAVGLFVALSQVLVLLLSAGRAFQPMNCGGILVPLYAGFAIGFRELARVLFKWWAVQFPFLLPFVLIFSALAAQLFGWALKDALLWGLKCYGLMFGFRFLWVTFAFSSGTNDSSSFSFRRILLILVAVLGFFLFLVLGAMSFVQTRPAFAWTSLTCAIIEAYSLLRFYGCSYNRHWFDLMKPHKR